MNQEACPLPATPADDEAAIIRRILGAKRIAVVGLSDDPMRTSHHVAAYLQSQGYRILPVNPNCTQVLGEPCHATLAEIAGQFDIVEVFRRSEYCEQVTREAIAAGARGVWLQSGIVSDGARRAAREAGIDFIQNRCMMVDQMRA
jgi:predicted CoA-binding protein